MKKILVILIMTLLGYESISAEKAPILPRKANNGEYSIAEMEKFSLGDGQVSTWFRTNLLMLVNRGLLASGQSLKVDASNISWIFQHITYDFKDLGPYTNSRLSDGTPEWFQDKDGWSGNVGVFRYGNCTIILFKTQCGNLLDIPAKVTPPTTVTPPSAVVVEKKDTVYIQTVAAAQPISITITNTNTNTNTIGASQPSTGGVEYSFEEEEYYRPRREVVYVDRPQVIHPRMGWQGFVNLNIRGGRQHQGFVNQTPIVRTMSTGIPAGNNSPGGGVGGVVRTMSPGLRN